MKRYRTLFGLFLTLTTVGAWPQATHDLTASLAGKGESVLHWSEVPVAVRDALVERWKDGAIAGPGAPFQATDVIMPGERPPVRRLVFAAKSPHAWIVCYEKGGIAHGFLVAVVPLGDKASSTEVWVALLEKPVKDLDSLRALARAHGYKPGDFD